MRPTCRYSTCRKAFQYVMFRILVLNGRKLTVTVLNFYRTEDTKTTCLIGRVINFARHLFLIFKKLARLHVALLIVTMVSLLLFLPLRRPFLSYALALSCSKGKSLAFGPENTLTPGISVIHSYNAHI